MKLTALETQVLASLRDHEEGDQHRAHTLERRARRDIGFVLVACHGALLQMTVIARQADAMPLLPQHHTDRDHKRGR